MKKINQKGFTLIEIIAVVIILGVLMLLAVPSVTKYINSSKRDTYKANLKNMITSVNNEVLSKYNKKYDFDEETEYMIVPFSCIELEKGDKNNSPFAKYVTAYSFIIVEGTEVGYNYKVQALDYDNFGTKLSEIGDIKIEGLDASNLSYITKDENNYEIQLNNYSNDKTPYILTCESFETEELPS